MSAFSALLTHRSGATANPGVCNGSEADIVAAAIISAFHLKADMLGNTLITFAAYALDDR